MQSSSGRNSGGDSPGAVARRRHHYLAYALATAALLFLIGLGACAWYVATLIPRTPGVADFFKARNAEPSVLLSAQGSQLAVFSEGRQQWVALADISPHVIDALIATEDHRFYDHPGFDPSRTLAATWHTIGGVAQGGSTITQQLVRNMFPDEIGRARTVERKLREIITAVKIEQAYSKEEILETYLNSVPFLYNVIGIEMAARAYFNKPAAALDVVEAATLVGMLKGTSYYNPVIHPERAWKRRNVVLAQMAKRGKLTEEELNALRDRPLHVRLTRQADPLDGPAPHFAAHVRKWLLQWAAEHDYNLSTDGLVIHSTLDDRLQEAAISAVDRQSEVLQNIADVEWGQKNGRVISTNPGAYASLRAGIEPFSYFWNERPELLDSFIRETPNYKKAVASGAKDAATLAELKANAKFVGRLRESKTRLEAGFVAIDPANGEVKAWVGSRDFERDQFDHVAQAERQPGSTFKPFVYGAALEHGITPDHEYFDGPVEIRAADGSVWRPNDMTAPSEEFISMREGLILSRNAITVQVMQDVGIPGIVDLASAAGINESKLEPVPSLALGTSPVTLLEMTSAYATIARLGKYRPTVMVKRITDRNGKVVAEFGESDPEADGESDGTRVMTRDTALELIDMMRGVLDRGTGQTVKTQFKLMADIAGKTGTTQRNTDGWFMLMHPRLVAGAWVGFNDQRVTMRSDHWGQGGHNAALLVGDFFKDALAAKLVSTKAQFPKPNRPPPLLVRQESEPSSAVQPLAPAAPAALAEQVPPGYGIVTSRSGDVFIVGPSGVRKLERPATEGGDGSAGIAAAGPQQ